MQKQIFTELGRELDTESKHSQDKSWIEPKSQGERFQMQ